MVTDAETVEVLRKRVARLEHRLGIAQREIKKHKDYATKARDRRDIHERKKDVIRKRLKSMDREWKQYERRLSNCFNRVIKYLKAGQIKEATHIIENVVMEADISHEFWVYAQRIINNPRTQGACPHCEINLFGEEKLPGVMPCGVEGCPYETPEEQAALVELEHKMLMRLTDADAQTEESEAHGGDGQTTVPLQITSAMGPGARLPSGEPRGMRRRYRGRARPKRD